MRTITLRLRPSLEVKKSRLEESTLEYQQCFAYVSQLIHDRLALELQTEMMQRLITDAAHEVFPWLHKVEISWEFAHENGGPRV